MENKKKSLIVLAIMLFLSSYTYSGSTILNGSFEDGLDNWTVSIGTDFDRRALTTDGNQLVGVIETYDMNVQDGTLAVFAYEHRACGGSISNCHTDVTVFSGDVEIINRELTRGGLGGSQRISMAQFCGTAANSGVLKFRISYLNNAVVNTDVNYTHSSQTLTEGDKICFWGEGDGDAAAGNVEGVVTVDNFQLIGHTLAVTEPVEPIPENTSFTVRATVTDLNGSNIANADVNISIIGGDTNVAMVFSNGQYRATFASGLANGNHILDINSTWEEVAKSFSGILEVRTQEFQYSTITPIQNIASFSFNSVDFIPINEAGTMIWRKFIQIIQIFLLISMSGFLI